MILIVCVLGRGAQQGSGASKLCTSPLPLTRPCSAWTEVVSRGMDLWKLMQGMVLLGNGVSKSWRWSCIYVWGWRREMSSASFFVLGDIPQ